MLKKILLFCAVFAIGTTTQAQFGKILDKAKETAETLKSGEMGSLTDGEIGNGLKEALNVGVKKAVTNLSKEKGYLESPYKILIPEDARQVTNKLKAVPGFNDVEKKLVNKMNEAAEIAAKKATPIFVNAIKSMSIQDAKNILLGDKNAATLYLKSNTFKSLYAEFMPVVQGALDEVNARTYWSGAVKTYNKIPLTKDANPNLDDHVTRMALNGLFKEVEVKEKDIRANQSSRTSDLLKKVFSKQD